MQVKARKAVIIACGAAATLLIAAAMSFSVPRTANALPAYAQQTGKPCGACHVNPAGGGKLNSFGEKFKANGHKLPK
jgi:hypothetical protein